MLESNVKKVLTTLLVLGATAGAANAATSFTANFSPDQNVGGSTSTDSGTGTLQITTEGLAYDLFFAGGSDFGPILGGDFGPLDPGSIANFEDESLGLAPTDVTRLHIHLADRGDTGPVTYGVLNPYTDADNDISITEDGDGFRVTGMWDFGAEGFQNAVDSMLAVGTGEDTTYYWNLHTNENPAGAIRAQIVGANGISAIPLPAGLPLLALALGGLYAVRRRGA